MSRLSDSLPDTFAGIGRSRVRSDSVLSLIATAVAGLNMLFDSNTQATQIRRIKSRQYAVGKGFFLRRLIQMSVNSSIAFPQL
jgi:hypothetical protein